MLRTTMMEKTGSQIKTGQILPFVPRAKPLELANIANAVCSSAIGRGLTTAVTHFIDPMVDVKVAEGVIVRTPVLRNEISLDMILTGASLAYLNMDLETSQLIDRLREKLGMK
ncbi:hypothetical protein D3C78_676740 [compost metagenome]